MTMTGSGAQTGTPQKETASAQVGRIADSVMDSAASMIDEQRGVISEKISSLGGAVRHSAEKLQANIPIAGSYVEKAADQIDRAANALKDRDLRELARDGQAFAKARPYEFVAACALIGFLAARFVNSSRS